MNTHTKKLFDRALDQAVPETWTQLSHEQMTELASVFAELMVRECAEVGSKFSQAHPLDIQYQIKRHFGVEE